MLYNPPSGATGANDPYVGKNVSGGTQGSKVPRLAVEGPQREIVNAVAASGQAPTNSDLTQLTGAMGRGIWLGLLTLTLGTPNALAGTIGAPASGAAPGYVQTLQPWTKLRGRTIQTNTSKTVNVTVIGVGSPTGTASGVLLRRDGQPPAIGDVPVGPCDFQLDDTGNFRLVQPTPSEMREITAASPAGRGGKSFSTAGPGTWTVPSVAAGDPYDVYWVKCTCIGGGAGGSGCGLNGTQSGAGGGAGGTAVGWVAVTPGQAIPYFVGDGSLGAGYQTNSANGATSSIGSFMSATGGGGTTNNGLAGGQGGVGIGGQDNLRGGSGVDGNSVNPLNPGGPGGGSSLGGGGRAATQYSPAVCDGQAAGSGGGGIYNNQFNSGGGRGAPGSCKFEY